MKTKFSGILTLLLAFVVHLTYAQDKTISGTVSDESGMPLPGVNIIIKGTSNGTQTDFDGNYSLNAATGSTLTFSYVGYKTIEQVVGASNTINVTMAEDVAQLEEVVVTAQGFEKEKKSLGYAVSEVKSENLEAKPSADLNSVLRGQVAGLNITQTSGMSGAASNVIIRGFTSITGGNQPLYIVDGVPINGDTNSDFNNSGGFLDNINQVSRVSDIDPNNIESVNVLKGLNAAVLYGAAGRNGVVIITTKTGTVKEGASKLEVTVNQSMFASEAHLPDYQNEYGGGFSQRFGFFVSNWGPAFNETNSSFFGSSFIRNEGGVNIIVNPLTNLGDQSLLAGVDFNPEYEYKPYESVENFFRTGYTTNTSVLARGGTDKVSFSTSFSHLSDSGVTPENTLRRTNFSVGGQAKLSNKFTISGSANYVKTDVKSPPVSATSGGSVGTPGNSSSIFANLLYTPRHVDLFGLPFQSVDGRSIYYRSGNDIQNPRWTLRNAKTASSTNRLFGNVNVKYNFNENNFLNFRTTLDTYSENTSNSQNRGGVLGNVTGFHNTSQNTSFVFDNNLSYNGQWDINDKNNLTYIVGATTRHNSYETFYQSSTDQLVFGVLNHFNFVNQVARQSRFTDNTIGAYLDATYGYDGYLFGNVSLRNDWTSTLETENNSILYFGASASFVPTLAFPSIKGDILNYMKFRIGYGQSAGFPTVYSTRNTLGLTPRGFDSNGNIILFNTVSNRLGNPDLKPERVGELELGIDSRLFKSRLGLNVSLFNKKTQDLISDRNLDPSSGYTVTRINSGEL
jgi:TonB-linked SusC/RagA family outer membrane protein